MSNANEQQLREAINDINFQISRDYRHGNGPDLAVLETPVDADWSLRLVLSPPFPYWTPSLSEAREHLHLREENE